LAVHIEIPSEQIPVRFGAARAPAEFPPEIHKKEIRARSTELSEIGEWIFDVIDFSLIEAIVPEKSPLLLAVGSGVDLGLENASENLQIDESDSRRIEQIQVFFNMFDEGREDDALDTNRKSLVLQTKKILQEGLLSIRSFQLGAMVGGIDKCDSFGINFFSKSLHIGCAEI